MARPSSRKRKRLATAIYEDKYGIGIQVRKKEHRYPLGTPLEQLLKERKRLRDDAGPAPSRRGTLRADCAAHLLTVPEGRARDEQRVMLEHWCAVFGDRASGSLTALEIKQQRAAWLTIGPNTKPLSKKHLNNMLHALRAVYRTHYGKDINPAADVPIFTVAYTDARAIPDAIVDRILNGMADTRWPPTKQNPSPPPNLAKLRLRVMREVGLSQAMLKRVKSHDLRFAAKTVYTEMRLKGRGVIGATVPLTAAGVKAFRALVKAGGLGPFSTRSLAAAWSRAEDRARRAWDATEATKARPRPFPLHANARAYDLRHTFGTVALIASGGDLEGTANLMRHANINTTRRYAQAASDSRARAAVRAMNTRGRLP